MGSRDTRSRWLALTMFFVICSATSSDVLAQPRALTRADPVSEQLVGQGSPQFAKKGPVPRLTRDPTRRATTRAKRRARYLRSPTARRRRARSRRAFRCLKYCYFRLRNSNASDRDTACDPCRRRSSAWSSRRLRALGRRMPKRRQNGRVAPRRVGASSRVPRP